MKTRIYLLCLLAAGILTSCSETKTTDSKDAGDVAKAPETSVSYTVDAAASELAWKGSKKLGDSHSGTIAIESGKLDMLGDSLVAGDFVIDMTKISETNPESEEKATKLIGHLSSGDFFQVDSFPKAMFAVTGFDGKKVSGNLTIKGVTKEISIPAEMVSSEEGMTITSSFSIDRTDWGVMYGARETLADKAKDDFINDAIEFNLSLKAKKA